MLKIILNKHVCSVESFLEILEVVVPGFQWFAGSARCPASSLHFPAQRLSCLFAIRHISEVKLRKSVVIAEAKNGKLRDKKRNLPA